MPPVRAPHHAGRATWPAGQTLRCASRRLVSGLRRSASTPIRVIRLCTHRRPAADLSGATSEAVTAFRRTATRGLVAPLFIIAIALSVRVANAWEKFVILRVGKLQSVKGAGFFMIIPIIDNIVAGTARIGRRMGSIFLVRHLDGGQGRPAGKNSSRMHIVRGVSNAGHSRDGGIPSVWQHPYIGGKT